MPGQMDSKGTASDFFDIRRHVLPASHIRDSRRGVAREDAQLHLAFNHYIPRVAHPRQPDDPTFICAGGIGLAKELFEPVFQEITFALRRKKVQVRGFLIADPVFTGESALLNSDFLSTDVGWFDHARDLLFGINLLARELDTPLIGLGHSMGGGVITHMSLLHPNLFHTIVLIEPSIALNMTLSAQSAMLKGMLKRPNSYTARAAAATSIVSSPFYADWDDRVVAKVLETSFEPQDHKNPDGPVVRRTKGDMEAALMLKPNTAGIAPALETMTVQEREKMPLYDPDAPISFPWYRSEPITLLKQLPNLRPSVCYIIGGASNTSDVQLRSRRVATTGIGVGGSGGAKVGRVEQHIIPLGKHFLMFQKDCLAPMAQMSANWISREMDRWRAQRRADRDYFALGKEAKEKYDPVIKEALLEYHSTRAPDIATIVKQKVDRGKQGSKL